MYGDDAERKVDILSPALQDDKISQEAKNWLRSTFNL